MVNILTAQDKVASFIRKLQFYHRRVEVEDISMFPELTMALDETKKNVRLLTKLLSTYYQR